MSMRKIKEVLRLRYELKLDQRQVARSCSIAVSTVHEYLKRAEAAQISWPLPDGWDDTHLEAALYPSGEPKSQPKKSPPDFAVVHEQLRSHRHVTMQLLWEEYREANPDGYRYSRFCELYQRWRKKLDVVMRQEHKAGEKAFIDWAGSTIPIYDRVTGVAWQASLFVAALGASSYTWAEATRDQQMEAWLRAHIHAFDYWGGVPALAVPDNTRTGVSKAHRYDPDINPTYHNFAVHYGFGVLPARPYKPRDKACASYCTLSRFDSGQDWLGRSSTAVPLCNCGIPKRFIKRVVAAVANDAAKKTGAHPFMHGRFGNAKRLAHLLGRQ
jgi:transposase